MDQESAKHKKEDKAQLAYQLEDQEMNGNGQNSMSDPGGIDFISNRTPLEIRNPGEGIKFKIDPAMLRLLQNAPGFVPVIINIQPMNDLKGFLGVPSEVSINEGNLPQNQTAVI